MLQSPPFVDHENGELELRQIWDEAIPIVGLTILFGALALLPYVLVVTIFEASFISLLLTLFAQLLVAVGAAIVLMYVITRAIQLADA
jgi:hypothetical protein